MTKVFGRGALSIPRQEESLGQDHAPMGKKHSWKVVRSDWEPVLHGSQDPGKLILRQGALFANLERSENPAGWADSGMPRDTGPRKMQRNSGRQMPPSPTKNGFGMKHWHRREQKHPQGEGCLSKYVG